MNLENLDFTAFRSRDGRTRAGSAMECGSQYRWDTADMGSTGSRAANGTIRIV